MNHQPPISVCDHKAWVTRDDIRGVAS